MVSISPEFLLFWSEKFIELWDMSNDACKFPALFMEVFFLFIQLIRKIVLRRFEFEDRWGCPVSVWRARKRWVGEERREIV